MILNTHGMASMPKPAPSEWGKLNAGQRYGILAIDLGRAIFGIAWGKYELPLIYRMIEHSWSPAKRKKEPGEEWADPQPCQLNLNAMANQWGYPRQRLYEARDRLLAINFLIKDSDGFWINKNAHEWTDPETGHPVLTPKMLAYAFGGRNRKDKPNKKSSVTAERDTGPNQGSETEASSEGSPEASSEIPECEPEGFPPLEDVTPERDTMSHSSVTSINESTPVCHVPALQDVTVQRDTAPRSSVTPHIEERTRGDFETNETLNTPLPPEGEPADEDDESAPPQKPEPTILKIRKEPDPEIVAELEELSKTVLGDRGEWGHLFTQIRGWLFSFPADWVRDVIYCLGANEGIKPDGLARYGLKCLQNWWPDGPRGKDAKTVAAARMRFKGESSPDAYVTATAEETQDIEAIYEAERLRGQERAKRRARRAAP